MDTIAAISTGNQISAIGILRRKGYTVTNRDFLRVGLPFTLTAVTAGYLFLWVVWGA